jgi:hypothetical protein
VSWWLASPFLPVEQRVAGYTNFLGRISLPYSTLVASPPQSGRKIVTGNVENLRLL